VPTKKPHQNPLLLELTGKESPVEWILPEFLPRGALLALAGVPGAGKSYLCYYLSMAVACGLSVLGLQPPRPFRVVYFDEENSRPDRIQYERWAWHGLGKPALDRLIENFWPVPFALGSSEWAEEAAAILDELQPDLFVVDTATPACDIRNENDNGEAAQVIAQLRHLMRLSTPEASALVLKHAKLIHEDGSYTLRGAKTWMGQVDSFSFLVRAVGRPTTDARKRGLSRTRLVPGKVRAFGLRTPLLIEPRFTADFSGLSLTRLIGAKHEA